MTQKCHISQRTLRSFPPSSLFAQGNGSILNDRQSMDNSVLAAAVGMMWLPRKKVPFGATWERKRCHLVPFSEHRIFCSKSAKSCFLSRVTTIFKCSGNADMLHQFFAQRKIALRSFSGGGLSLRSSIIAFLALMHRRLFLFIHSLYNVLHLYHPQHILPKSALHWLHNRHKCTLIQA